jgi:hypothetical protein
MVKGNKREYSVGGNVMCLDYPAMVIAACNISVIIYLNLRAV